MSTHSVQLSKQPSLYLFSLEHPVRRFCIWLTVDNGIFELLMLLIVVGNCVALAFPTTPLALEFALG
jgi:hypothetical protein